MFIAAIATGEEGSPLYAAMGLFRGSFWQPWRLITFQFMHGGPGHLLLNMAGLYFFGAPLEQAWGRRRFLAFYLACGSFAGLCFMGIAEAMSINEPLIGASGGVLACVMGSAILFPQFRVLLVPIRWVAGFLGAMYVLSLLWTPRKNLADAAHLGGMLAAAAWIALTPRMGRMGWTLAKRRAGRRWRSRVRRLGRQQDEIDRILQKIHDQGIGSLTNRERKRLASATREQRRQEEELRRHRGRFLG